jgi:predicted nucleic acid-binding protein
MTPDANIVIAYLGGEEGVIKQFTDWQESGLPLILSTVVEAEVLSFSQWTDEEYQAAERFLEENFTLMVFDRNIARMAADIRRNKKMKFPDAAIAATALFTHTPVVTRNVRDFKGLLV